MPVVSFNMAGLESNPGFKITRRWGKRLLLAVMYGDLFQRLLSVCNQYRMRRFSGRGGRYHEKYEAEIFRKLPRRQVRVPYKRLVQEIVPITIPCRCAGSKAARVGVVGRSSSNTIRMRTTISSISSKKRRRRGGRTGLIDFFLYGMYHKKFNYENLSGTYQQYKLNQAAIVLVEQFRRPLRRLCAKADVLRSRPISKRLRRKRQRSLRLATSVERAGS